MLVINYFKVKNKKKMNQNLIATQKVFLFSSHSVKKLFQKKMIVPLKPSIFPVPFHNLSFSFLCLKNGKIYCTKTTI